MILVLLESPFAGEVELNQAYARACMRDCLLRGEAPFASHLLYTQPGVLDDLKPEERKLGIEAGLFWGQAAAKTVVYTDRGISPGMNHGIQMAQLAGREVEFRRLGHEDWIADWIEADSNISGESFNAGYRLGLHEGYQNGYEQAKKDVVQNG